MWLGDESSSEKECIHFFHTFPPTCHELGEGFLLSCGSREKETLKVGAVNLGPWLKQGRARLSVVDGGQEIANLRWS